LFDDSLSMFIKIDTSNLDTVSNRIKDYFTLPNDLVII
jgi:hypothetical protein